MDDEKIVIKTEPMDSFDWDNQQLDIGAGKKELPKQSKENSTSFSAAEIAEKVKNIKRRLSSHDDSNDESYKADHYDDNVFSETMLDKEKKCKPSQIKRSISTDEDIQFQNKSKTERVSFKRSDSDSYDNYHYHTLASKQDKSEEDSQNTVDLKPDIADLDDESRPASKSNSIHSLSGDNSLGKTLATSLQLIATNTASSPIVPSSTAVNHTQSRTSPSSSSHSSCAATHVVVISPVDPPRRYRTRSASKTDKPKRERRTRSATKISNAKVKEKDVEMMKPLLNKDGSVTLYQCEECNKVFNKKQTLRQHFITHTNRFACPYCDARCKSKGDLRTHIQTHTKEKPFHCDICNTDYTRESILRKHMKTQTHIRACYERDNMLRLQSKEPPNTCEKEVDQFVPSQTKVRLEGFSCRHCKKVVFCKSEYKKHVKSHSFKHVCNICQKGCINALLLKIHKRSHTKNNLLSCKVCSRTFANLYRLKEHVKTHKSLNINKPSQEMLIKAAINKHNKDLKQKMSTAKSGQTSSAKGGKLECEICQKTFSSEKRFENHSRVHEGTYVCGVCKKTFGSVPKLKIHLRFHGRMFHCDTCDKSFFDDKDLQDHIHIQHVMERNYPCKICNERFITAGDLKEHVNHHAPTMLFSGASLEESTIPVVSRTGKKGTSSGFSVSKFSESEDSSEEETRKQQESAKGDSDDESILSSHEFFDIINSALDGSDDNMNDSELSDSDDDLFEGIKSVLESEVLTSGESDLDNKDSYSLQKPIMYSHNEIIKKHAADFDRYTEKDEETKSFVCKLCDLQFEEIKYLKNHFKCHVCEYCNKFFTDKEKLAAHKARHVKQLLKEIKNEAQRLHIPKQGWKGYLMVSSESDDDFEDQFLNELEDILEGEPPKVPRSVYFLHTLSHEEIVRANKQIFDHYSCLDLTNNIFACTICKRKYARPTTLTRHFKTHVCQFCNKFFEDKSDLLEHKYRHRKKAALMKAEITGEGSKMPPSPIVSKQNRDMFKRYSYIDAERNINRCTLCCKDFVRRTVLTRHMKTHICSHCDKFFEDKYDLAKHTSFHKVEKHYLDEDDANNEDYAEFDEEEKQYSNNSSITGNLDADEKTIALTPSFSAPMGHFNPSYHPQPPCNSRNDTITFIQIPNTEGGDNSSTHVYTGSGSGASSYQIISQPVDVYKDTAQESFLVASTSCQGQDVEKIIAISQPQIVTSGSESRERLFECGECGKRFFKNGHLKSHMTIHTGDRPFVCRLCGKAFGRGTTLRKHEKTHMKRCKICDTSFNHKYELDLHMQIHRTYAFYK
ncbi:zinc finger protein Xfin [Biomphalaria glabrata]|nr:zinc finger protein Xfin [Biomphalaria glabrata]